MPIHLGGFDQPFSTTLRDVANGLPADTVTLRELLQRIGRQGMLAFAVLLTTPFLLPVSIPGTSTPLGLLIAAIGAGIALERAPWLPDFALRRVLPVPALARVLDRTAWLFVRLEKLVHPRWLALSRPGVTYRLNGALLCLSGLLLALPLPIPLTNTVPAWAALLLAIGVLQRDGGFLVAGYVALVLSMAMFTALAVGAIFFGLNAGAIMHWLFGNGTGGPAP
jgi:hypothetical protein